MKPFFFDGTTTSHNHTLAINTTPITTTAAINLRYVRYDGDDDMTSMKQNAKRRVKKANEKIKTNTRIQA